MFCGQISTVYLFSEALSPQQIHGVYQLGPSYKVQATVCAHACRSARTHYRDSDPISFCSYSLMLLRINNKYQFLIFVLVNLT
jgi:hypothetical protein